MKYPLWPDTVLSKGDSEWIIQDEKKIYSHWGCLQSSERGHFSSELWTWLNYWKHHGLPLHAPSLPLPTTFLDRQPTAHTGPIPGAEKNNSDNTPLAPSPLTLESVITSYFQAASSWNAWSRSAGKLFWLSWWVSFWCTLFLFGRPNPVWWPYVVTLASHKPL